MLQMSFWWWCHFIVPCTELFFVFAYKLPKRVASKLPTKLLKVFIPFPPCPHYPFSPLSTFSVAPPYRVPFVLGNPARPPRPDLVLEAPSSVRLLSRLRSNLKFTTRPLPDSTSRLLPDLGPIPPPGFQLLALCWPLPRPRRPVEWVRLRHLIAVGKSGPLLPAPCPLFPLSEFIYISLHTLCPPNLLPYLSLHYQSMCPQCTYIRVYVWHPTTYCSPTWK